MAIKKEGIMKIKREDNGWKIHADGKEKVLDFVCIESKKTKIIVSLLSPDLIKLKCGLESNEKLLNLYPLELIFHDNEFYIYKTCETRDQETMRFTEFVIENFNAEPAHIKISSIQEWRNYIKEWKERTDSENIERLKKLTMYPLSEQETPTFSFTNLLSKFPAGDSQYLIDWNKNLFD